MPLIDLSGIRVADALQVDWPEVDAIIGNPPFLGGGQLRGSLGGDYVEWLKSTFHAGVRDLCTYWFRKANDHLKPGQRAGLVGTNSISQNMGREASLDYIVANHGVITDAVSSEKWPGDAKVHVSIVNWVKSPGVAKLSYELDTRQVRAIGTDLREAVESTWRVERLAANANHCFEGPSPKSKGLLVDSPTASALLRRTDADYSDVVRPFLTASDITDDSEQLPSRWAIDFGLRSLESSLAWPGAMEIVRRLVKPEREHNNRKSYRDLWWLFAEPRRGMRKALEGLPRYIAIARHGKRVSVTWVEAADLASDATNVFAFDDDYSMGILMSRAHDAWAWARSSTLETRLRYTPTTVFETFPWPCPVSDVARSKVTSAASALYARRSELCLEHSLGLTKLYNLMDDGAFIDLAALHKTLDVAVAAAYGWPSNVAQHPEELVARLTELNRQITQGERPYNPFGVSVP